MSTVKMMMDATTNISGSRLGTYKNKVLNMSRVTTPEGLDIETDDATGTEDEAPLNLKVG